MSKLYSWPKMRSADRVGKCLLFAVNRTCRGHHETDAFDAVDGAHSETSECHRVVALKCTTLREPSMGEVITIGLDIAKSVFQAHGVDGAGAVVIRKRVSRAKLLGFFASLQPCLVGIEACPAAHHWGRELQALGHTVKLMPPSYVKAYLKRSKNDANDAAAICEAVTRPSMRFVPIKTKEQQAALMLQRARQLLVRQRTMLSNAIRGHLAELGIVSAKGRNRRFARDHCRCRGWPGSPSGPRDTRCAGASVRRHRSRDRIDRPEYRRGAEGTVRENPVLDRRTATTAGSGLRPG